jgi:hypothetical protein
VVRSLLLLLLLACAAPAQELAWERTLVFAVGVLDYQDPALGDFAQEGRRDVELVELLRARGAREVVFLADAEAARARLDEAFEALLSRSEAGQTLVVYFTGHGGRDAPSGEVAFVPWDGRGDDLATCWSARAIVDAIDARFRGDRALLLADCCHSGALADLAAARVEGRVSFAALTSAQASSSSTETWAFTETVLHALRGSPFADGDRDGQVTLAEAAALVEAEMAFVEGQRSAFHADPALAALRLVASGPQPPDPRIGHRLEAFDGDAWRRARVTDTRGDELRVRFIGETEERWVSADHVRAYRPLVRPVGEAVEVEWEGSWYPATILEARRDGLHKVRYDGYDASWDEWVSLQRVRDRTSR